MDFETCYVYKPSSRQDTRPNKRRRVEPSGLHSSWPLRRSVYQRLWSEQEQRLKDLQSEINEVTISQISTFVQDAPQNDLHVKVASALILTGPSIASHALLFDQLYDSITKSKENVFVAIASSLAPNLKTVLKHLIQRATSSYSAGDEDEDEEAVVKPNRSRLLNYDLRLLHEHVQEKKVPRVVVAFQDCEAFDGQLLSDIIELLSCWRDRIPFVFLFGVATSIQDFQAKLSKKATRCIQGQRFDTIEAEAALEKAFENIHSENAALWIGAGSLDTTLKRQRDHIQSLDAFGDSIHYAYLSHFYANALTMFLDESLSLSQVSTDHFRALRQLPSFQVHIQSLLEQKQASVVRGLLDSDSKIFEYTKEHLLTGTWALSTMIRAVNVLYVLQASVSAAQQVSMSSLVVDALGGQLHGSPWMRTALLRLRRCNSETLLVVLTQLLMVSKDELNELCGSLLSELSHLLQGQKAGGGPLRSEEDLQNATLRTTIVAKKVELSKQKSTMTKGDTAYSSLLRRLVVSLEEYFAGALIDPKALVFNEIFIYDLKSPHRDVFTPKPRFAVERALAAPHDYLDCACCAPDPNDADENTLSASQPATAVLYQLYLESGALVNVSDLRTAFIAITDTNNQNEAQITALFQRSLAELRYLGLVRGTRKKADHMMKMSWRGL